MPQPASNGGIWDSAFVLIFGRRSAPAPRPTPQPAPPPAAAPAPQPTPPIDAAPAPAPAPQPAQPIDAAPAPEPAPAPTPEPASPVDAAPEPAPAPTQEPAPPVNSAPAPAPDIIVPAPAPVEAPAHTISAFSQRLVDFCVGEWNFFQRGQVRETQEPGSTRIAAYWTNVGKDGWSGQTTDQPWSAAFISFAIKEAGDNGRFTKSTGHCVYINEAIRKRDDANAAFQGKRIEDYAPQIGDLICRNRSEDPSQDQTFDSAPNASWYPSHTDIVTAIKPGEVEMIGGNVGQSVSVSRLKLLPDGRLDPAVAASKRVFAIMKNNL